MRWPTTLDFTDLVEPGDRIVWSHGSAEPVGLVRRLAEQSAELPDGVEVFLTGVGYSGALTAEAAARLRVKAVGGFGRLAELSRAGLLDVVPCRYSDLPRLVEDGPLRADVALVLTSLPDDRGFVSLATGVDVTHEVLAGARTTVAQVNAHAPFTYGDTLVPLERFDAVVQCDHPLVEAPPAPASPELEAICGHVAARVPDGATLQVGIGNVGSALPRALLGRRRLGVHSGLFTDALLDLCEAGAADGSAKETDRGLAVAGAVLGSQRLYAAVDRYAPLALRRCSYLLSEEVLSSFRTFVSVNSALEVDLTGQVDAETRGGVHVGAVGGQVDYVRAGARARDGMSVVALPSATRSGRSRIVPRLADGVVTTGRCEVDLVVTEYGIAELQGRSLSERAERLVAIAHPSHREELRASFDALC